MHSVPYIFSPLAVLLRRRYLIPGYMVGETIFGECQEYFLNFYDSFFSPPKICSWMSFEASKRPSQGKSVFGEIAVPVGSQAEQMLPYGSDG